MVGWRRLDEQMAQYDERLIRDVRLDVAQASSLATSVAADIRCLSTVQKSELTAITPVKLRSRLDEIKAFQMFNDFANLHSSGQSPELVRARVVYQNYVCFCYLSEALFLHVKRFSVTGSAAKKCAKFLTSGRVRYFRNGFAHGNWEYSNDFSGIIYWSRKGSELSDPLEKFEVAQDELSFWQMLAKCVGYCALSDL